MMKTSNVGLSLITHYEGLNDNDLSIIGLQPKMDPRGIWTSGWGHAIVVDSKFLIGKENQALAYSMYENMTEEDADTLLFADLTKEESKMRRNITVQLLQHQYDALVSYFYNIGFSETMAQLVNAKSTPKQITDWFVSHYIKGDGKILQGLVYRRQSEAHLFTTGELKFFN